MSPWWHWTVYWNVPSATTATVSSKDNYLTILQKHILLLLYFEFIFWFFMFFFLQVYQWVCVGHSGVEWPDHRPSAKDFTPLGMDLLENTAGKTIQKGLEHCTQVQHMHSVYCSSVTQVIQKAWSLIFTAKSWKPSCCCKIIYAFLFALHSNVLYYIES